jgi:hypothetical protein
MFPHRQELLGGNVFTLLQKFNATMDILHGNRLN